MGVPATLLPAEFDHAAFENQLRDWSAEGHTDDDILVQARHTWPELPEGYTLATLHSLKRINKPEDFDPLADLKRIHARRDREISQVEKALEAASAAVSKHNLYRGLLRDHEAACYRFLELAKQSPSAAPANKTAARELKADIAQARKLRQEHREAMKQLDDLARPPSRNGMLSTMNWLIAFVLSTFLTGCSTSARTVPTISYTVSTPLSTRAVSPARDESTVSGTGHGERQGTSQLFAPSAENHQTLLQRTAHNPARSPGATGG